MGEWGRRNKQWEPPSLKSPSLKRCHRYRLARSRPLCIASWMTLTFLLVAISTGNAAAFQVLPTRKVSTRGGQVPCFNLYNGYCQYPTSTSLLNNPRVDAKIARGQSIDATSSESKQEIFDGVVTAGATSKPTSVEEEAIFKSAIVRTLGWVGAASLFGAFLVMSFGAETGTEFFAGYLVEQSLSVDNLFVFLLLFEYFKVPLESQDRVLNWGILGAIVMRAVMIGIGAAALQNLHEILLVFAGILVYSSVKALTPGEEKGGEDPGENAIVKFSQSVMSSNQEFDGDRFFTIIDGVKKATPLFMCMIAVEISDVVFAIDSIPAVFGVTEKPLIVFTSNMFAIMGLRSLYTILSKAAANLKYLEPAVAVVLGFIGFKMIAEYFGYGIPTGIALIFVAALLGTGVGLSVWEKKLEATREEL